jgi:hypothetical protein
VEFLHLLQDKMAQQEVQQPQEQTKAHHQLRFFLAVLAVLAVLVLLVVQ